MKAVNQKPGIHMPDEIYAQKKLKNQIMFALLFDIECKSQSTFWKNMLKNLLLAKFIVGRF